MYTGFIRVYDLQAQTFLSVKKPDTSPLLFFIIYLGSIILLAILSFCLPSYIPIRKGNVFLLIWLMCPVPRELSKWTIC